MSGAERHGRRKAGEPPEEPYEPHEPYGPYEPAESDEPAEHLRYAAHLDALARVAGPDEPGLIGTVLTDPDRTMAQAAVLRHLDRRAAQLCSGPGWEEWARTMTRTVARHPFLTRRLREWSLFRAVTLRLPWHEDELLAASDWLQLKTVAGPNPEASAILAERGRTKRIRTTARTSLPRQREH
ncbi:hypothetical protein [Streptomyces olindensis]|uniref:hypothetical protein n=1 Tax=Streptomyces olindensis TaxID=358823 RepID=UPI0034088160